MDNLIPKAADVRAKLASLSQSELEVLAAKCGVPLPTLVKIKYGQTENPRLDTVRAIWPELINAQSAPAVDARQEAA
jgi:predicted transcriptional regulator